MDSILNTIKQMLGIEPSLTAFDVDVTVDINTVLLSLHQLGIGPPTCYSITGSEEKWSDFLGEAKDLEAVKSYIFLKVKMMFDTTASQTILNSMTNQATELEFRLLTQAEGLVSDTTI
jgi:hypothetical protein